MKQETLDIKSVCECNRCLGCKTLHPQATIINLEHPHPEQEAVKFDFYAVLLIEACAGKACCGREYYDYSYATMVFLNPGEIFRMSEAGALPDKGRLLAFHPDLLHTSLKRHMRDYAFFSYGKDEALHLSCRETATITCCLENIEEELRHSIDSHTAIILSRHIELMLDYCARFYERQFITRENKNKIVLQELDALLDAYLASGQLQRGLLPTADYCAAALGMSAPYFSDLLKFETGKTLDEYFRLRRLNAAKELLLRPENTPAAVADRLGYPSVQYFSLLFKRITGMAPAEYRCSRN